jgi:hypothetical protein
MSSIHHHEPEINKSFLSLEMLKAYKLAGKMIFQGLPVSIENAKGSVRKWYDPHNKQEGETKMRHAYGYIRGTKGTDGDHVDCYIGPDKNAKQAFVVHQMKAPDFKKFDEDKVMLGFPSAEAARSAYMKQYDKPGFFGSMTPMSMEDFKEKVLATKDNPQVIKSLEDLSKGKTSDMVVWHVSAEHPERTAEEEAFGNWLHSHPMHEHDQHWAEFLQATKLQPPPTPPSVREHADDAEHEPAEHQAEDIHWHPEHDQPEEEPEPAPEPTADEVIDTKKAFIDQMLSISGAP